MSFKYTVKQTPHSFRLQEPFHSVLTQLSKTAKADYIRRAVIEKMIKDGLVTQADIDAEIERDRVDYLSQITGEN
jgi:hypothetical protein